MAGSGKRILVVDDEPMFLEFLSEQLTLLGFTVHTAGSADEAMRSIVDQQFDILISDVRMPGGTGYDLVGLTRFVDGRIPVILISGNDPEEVMQEASHGAGVFRCLSKIDTKGLLTAVTEAIEASPAG